jgi:hypothetical protein
VARAIVALVLALVSCAAPRSVTPYDSGLLSGGRFGNGNPSVPVPYNAIVNNVPLYFVAVPTVQLIDALEPLVPTTSTLLILRASVSLAAAQGCLALVEPVTTAVFPGFVVYSVNGGSPFVRLPQPLEAIIGDLRRQDLEQWNQSTIFAFPASWAPGPWEDREAATLACLRGLH